MKHDSKRDKILIEPFKNIFEIASYIYKMDGKSLMKWINEPYKSLKEGGQGEERKEVSIATYKEQFKNMLSLDIWIDKLTQWQMNDYKLNMPQKEPVDPLQWNHTLKIKLRDAIRSDYQEMVRNAPNEQITNPDTPNAEFPTSNGNPRKRLNSNQYSGPETTKEYGYGPVKIKKLNDGNLDGMNRSVISTDKTSEISLAVRHMHKPLPPRPRPQVSMNNLFKKIENLKKEMKAEIHDHDSKNVIKLSQIDSNRIGVSQ
jgi:ribosomal protein S15P/S13E